MQKRGIGKRGSMTNEQMWTIFEILLFAMFILILFSFIISVKNSTIFERNYLARDLALVVDSLFSSPHKVSYLYDEDLSRFTVEFKEHRAQVGDVEFGDMQVDKIFWYGDVETKKFVSDSYDGMLNIVFKETYSSMWELEAIEVEPEPEKSPAPVPTSTPHS